MFGDNSLAAVIGGGSGLLGGTLDQAVFQPKENRRTQQGAQAQVDELNKALGMLMQTDYTGIEAAAGRQLQGMSGALDADLAARGVYHSGYAGQAQRDLTAGVMGNLSAQIGQDQLARQMAMLQTLQNPAYAQAGMSKSGK